LNDLTVGTTVKIVFGQPGDGSLNTGIYILCNVVAGPLEYCSAGNTGQSLLSQIGYTGGLPVGTQMAITFASDGNNFCMSAGAPFPTNWNDTTSPNAIAPFQGAFTGQLANLCYPVTTQNSGKYIADQLSLISYTTNSTTSPIGPLYYSNTFVGGPADGQLAAAFMMSPKVLNEPAPNAGGTYPAEILFSPYYGKPEGTGFIFYAHPNGYKGILAGATTYSLIYAPLLADNYSIGTITGDPQANNGAGPTSSHWGAPTGEELRQGFLQTVRKLYPMHNQAFCLGASMGGLTCLNLQRHYGGFAAILTYSADFDLTGSFNGTNGTTGFNSIIANAYGTWYQAKQNSTNVTPVTGAYWSQLNTFNTAIPPQYLNPSNFSVITLLGQSGTTPGYPWNSTANYLQNQIVGVAYSGSSAALAPFDPNLNTKELVNTPILSYHCNNDGIVPIGILNTFVTNLTNSATALGVTPNITTKINNPVSTGGPSSGFTTACSANTGTAHIDPSLFIASDVTTFFDTYRVSRTAMVNQPPAPTSANTADIIAPGVIYTGGGLNFLMASPTISSSSKASSTLSISNLGVTANSYDGNVTTSGFAAGAAAGTTPGTPTVSAGYGCTPVACSIQMVSGTAPTTTGVLLTVTTGITRTNFPVCFGSVNNSGSGSYPSIAVYITTTATTVVFNVANSIAETAGATYTYRYMCFGN
jgi:hypothetical protein